MIRLALLLAALVATTTPSAQEAATTPDESGTSDTVPCEFTGTHIERLELRPVDATDPDATIVLDAPHGRVDLAPDLYDYTVHLAEEDREGTLRARGWLTVSRDGPNVFHIGAPLESSLDVTRISARGFEIDFHLHGGAGEEYLVGFRSYEVPHVGIYCGDRELAIEDFSYG